MISHDPYDDQYGVFFDLNDENDYDDQFDVFQLYNEGINFGSYEEAEEFCNRICRMVVGRADGSMAGILGCDIRPYEAMIDARGVDYSSADEAVDKIGPDIKKYIDSHVPESERVPFDEGFYYTRLAGFYGKYAGQALEDLEKQLERVFYAQGYTEMILDELGRIPYELAEAALTRLVKEDWRNLSWIPGEYQTDELIELAVKENSEAFQFARTPKAIKEKEEKAKKEREEKIRELVQKVTNDPEHSFDGVPDELVPDVAASVPESVFDTLPEGIRKQGQEKRDDAKSLAAMLSDVNDMEELGAI